MKLYAATVQELKEKERQNETQFTTKTEVPPPPNPWMLMFFIFLKSHPIYDQTQESSVVFLILIMIISLLYILNDQSFLQSHMNYLWVYILLVFF